MRLPLSISWLCLGVVVTVLGQAPPHYNYPSTCAPANSTILDPSLPPTTKQPPLPNIPDTFQLRVEANIINKQQTWSTEEYYDDINNRAALRLLRNNSMDYMIFDYSTNQIIYDVNNNCSVTTLNRDPYGNEFIFGMKGVGGGSSGIPHIYTTSSALHFAKSNGLMYKGTKTIRGIQCDWWQSCMFWPNLFANFTLDYYFSVYNWTSPDLSPQVPVMAEIQGLSLTGNFHHTYEYFDYRNHIWDADSVFDTPQGKVCPGRTQTRKVPVLSGQYSYREEIVDNINRGVSEADVYYDYTYNLVRFDYRPPYSRYPYYATNPVSEIHDYSTGIAYAIDNYLGNCSMIPIQNTTFDASVKLSVNANQSQQFYIQMKSPSQLFYLDNTSYTYEGTRMVRGILCDVFISNRTDFHLPNYNTFTSTFEFYFMNNQWTASTSLGAKSKTNTNIPVQLRITAADWVGYQATYNIYNFDSEDPSYNRFSIANCYDDFSKKAFILEFPGSWDNSLLQYQNQFITQITNRLATVGHVSHIRVQNAQFRVESDQFYFVATLLDLPPPIAYFRKVTGRFRQFTNDLSVTVSSAADCARQCNDPGTLGQCNSFDYCAFQNLCGLSKSHTEDGVAIVTSSGQCDHYVRTTQTSNFNLALDIAWVNIKNDVLTGNFQIKVNINGQAATFTAGTIDDNVIQNAQRTLTTQSLMNQFNTQINKNIPGYDDAILTGIAIDDCASACVTQQSWVCNSFSYCFDTGYCVLSKLHPDERPSVVVNMMQCDLYTKKYTVDFEMIPGTTVLSSSNTVYHVNSVEMCAKLCISYKSFSCKSFEFCDNTSTCVLGHSHFYDIPKSYMKDSAICNHYSRKYLSDFKPMGNLYLTPVYDRVISGVNVEQCAKLCVEEEGLECASFAYCFNTTECRPRRKRNISQVSSLLIPPKCNVYNRETYRDGTPYSSISSSTTIPPTSTDTPKTGQTTNNYKEGLTEKIVLKDSSSSPIVKKGLSAGGVVGVAFGMLTAGLLIALIALAGIKRIKKKQTNEMKSTLTEHELE